MNAQKLLSIFALFSVFVIPSAAFAGGHSHSPRCHGGANADYTFATIDPPGSSATIANAISTHEIGGEYVGTDSNSHGFILKNRVYTTIDWPGAFSSAVNGISENGSIAGTYAVDMRTLPDGVSIPHGHAYAKIKGVFTTLDPPGSSESQGGFINARGEVVGGYRDKNDSVNPYGVRHAFHWYKGRFTTIDPPNGHPTLGPVAWGINDKGDVVGTYVDVNGSRHGFLLSKGTYTTLDVPGAIQTVAEGINNAGEIVGEWNDAESNRHGFVFRKGIYTPVDVPEATATAAFSINSHGQIVGLYNDDKGTHGYLATPTR